MTEKPTEDIPPLEWGAAALGFLLVAAALTFLVHAAVTATAEPPALEARVTRVSGHVVELEVRNSADSTAASVVVEGRLLRAGAVVEAAEVTFDYVPADSTRTGGLFFREDPGDGTVELRPLGYQSP